MESPVLAHEPLIRLAAFFGVFAVMATWELLAPRRALTVSRTVRWANNLGLVALNTVLLRLVFPTAVVGTALLAEAGGWGLLNRLELAHWAAVVVAVVALDFAIYLQHVMFHAVPALWRLHRVHHADLDFDLTTGARFHPIEIGLSMLIKLAVVVLLFGFNLPWWDRLLGTYRAQPRGGHAGMTLGIRTYRDPRLCAWLPGMLALPFLGKVSDYAINRRQWASPEASR